MILHREFNSNTGTILKFKKLKDILELGDVATFLKLLKKILLSGQPSKGITFVLSWEGEINPIMEQECLSVKGIPSA